MESNVFEQKASELVNLCRGDIEPDFVVHLPKLTTVLHMLGQLLVKKLVEMTYKKFMEKNQKYCIVNCIFSCSCQSI